MVEKKNKFSVFKRLVGIYNLYSNSGELNLCMKTTATQVHTGCSQGKL